MNEIKLKGLLRDIKPSHTIGEVEYDKANLIVARADGKEDILNLRFKKFSNTYTEDSQIELIGNVRSYSKQLETGKNKVEIYVFTYFDQPEGTVEDETSSNNTVSIDGRICKIDNLRTLSNGKKNIHFILANNLIINESSQKLNSYIPCIAWGKTAKDLSELSVNTKIELEGRLQSREYKKAISENDFEIRVAHELYVSSFKVVE